jgi:signal transduction histidine kinase
MATRSGKQTGARRGGAANLAQRAGRRRAVVAPPVRKKPRRDDLTRLAAWSLQLPSSGLVLLRDGAITVANPAFEELDRSLSGPLVREALPHESPQVARAARRAASLRDIAAVGAVAAAARRGPAAPAPRWERHRSLAGERWIDVLFDCQPDAGKRGVVCLAVFHDVTALVKAEARVLAAQAALARQEHVRAMGELAAGVVHDVSNMLAAIRLRLSALGRDAVCTAAQGSNIEALDRIVGEGTAMLQKLQRLGQAGGTDQAAAPVDLREAVAWAVEVAQSGLRYRAISEGIDIRIENLVPPLPAVMAWRDDLQRVFVNLLLNARDAMPRGGRIAIRGREARDHIVIEVEDQGTGISPAALPHIFEPYFTTKEAAGSGIGLATVQRAMARLGGGVSVANARPRGTVFTLCFPLRRTSTPELAAPPGRADLLLNPPD